VVLSLVGFCVAVQWADFRVKYDLNPVGHFLRKPKLLREALEQNWTLVNDASNCQNGGKYNGFRYVQDGDDSLALIYDVNGVIAGLQMMLPHSEILTPNNTFNFGNVAFFTNETFRGAQYYILTAYLVDPSIICTTGRNESDLLTRGTGDGVWVQAAPQPTVFLQIPDRRADALAQGWSNNNCFGGMGTHSWFRMEDYVLTNCTEQVPVFGLWNRQMELHGFGFSASGLTVRDNFENPPTAAVRIIVGAPGPDCLFETNDAVGGTTMHVYFIDSPWLASCS